MDSVPMREVSDADKALSKSLQKCIEDAIKDRDGDFKKFADNRKLLRGIDPATGKKMRTNLHFANLAAMRPQVYAKDPDFTVQPTRGVPPERLPAVRAFGDVAEAVLTKLLVEDAELKRRAKRILTSAYTNAIGWWKLSWQEGRPKDPLITNRIKDTQDNLDKLMRDQQAAQHAQSNGDAELKAAELRETLAGLQVEAEQKIGRGLALDFVMPEDLLVLDKSIFEVQDYTRAGKLAHGVWMTRCQFEAQFGYDPEKARVYKGKEDTGSQQSNKPAEGDKANHLLRVFEVWDQEANRVHTVCIGDEGLCRDSFSPDWTGKRWFPFFALIWNEVDGVFLPPSDVELTDELVREYNQTRQDFEEDRKDARPFSVVRKGGALTPADVQNIRNRKGNDIILVEGNGGNTPLSNDLQAVNLGTVNPANYDTSPPRQDIEMLVGGGDAARGSVLKAKTATEAEILSQGLRGRSAERTDVIEDLLSAVGSTALEICLRKLQPEEVAEIAGPAALQAWPQLSAEQVFRQVSVRVRGGSTGKPDRLQEQDRWTKLLPVIKDTVKEIVATRQAGQEPLAQLAMALLKETLRRFDEAFEVEQYLPEPQEGDMQQPEVTPEMVQQAKDMIQELQAKVQELEGQLADKERDIQAAVEKARIDADAKVRAVEITAPIEARAKVECQRLVSMAQQMAEAEPEAPEMPTEPGEPAEVAPDPMQQLVAAVIEGQQQIAAVVAQALAPKSPMQVVHERDGAGRLVRSVTVPVQAE